MATWQYSLHLIPRREVEDRYSIAPASLFQEALGEVDWWQNYQPPSSLAAFVNTFLPPRRHWDADTRAWGDEDGDSIAIMVEDNRVAEISVRVNVAQHDESFIGKIVELGLLCDALLFLKGGLLIVPDAQSLVRHINQSDAMRFVRDPEKFLVDLHDKREVA